MLDRAYATLDIKGLDEDLREIEGIATTPTPDRWGDVIESNGAEFTLPLPLLWQHNQAAPVGDVLEARVTPEGIAIKARFAKVEEPGALRDRLDEAWQSVKARLVRGLSIGFKPIEFAPLKKGGHHVKRWMWAELSAVTIPMNIEATIRNIKSAACGLKDTPAMPTYSERITEHETTRAALVSNMADLMDRAEPTGGALEGDASTKYDSYSARVKAIDLTIGRLRELETLNLAQATAVPVTPLLTSAPLPRVTIKSTVPKGTAFVRKACALLVCHGNVHEAAEYAKRWDDSTPEVALSLKAAIAPGTSTDAAWAGPLVNQTISTDFIELLRAATVVDRIAGLRTVPFNVKVPSQTAGGTYGWVGESKPKPLTKLAFSAETLGYTKVAGIIVLTEELVRLSSPSAETLVRADMIAGIARFIDAQFLDPAVAAVAGVNPASITNGAPTAVATTNPVADIMGLIAHFSTNNIGVDGVTIILSPTNALSLSFRQNLDGSPEFPGVTMAGGSFRGLQFITSNVAGTNVIALQPQLVLMADDGAVTIDASREASLQMDSAPASPADATTVYVSLWQTNTVGLRAERWINWKRANTNAVKYLTAAAWPAPTGGAMAFEAPAGRGK